MSELAQGFRHSRKINSNCFHETIFNHSVFQKTELSLRHLLLFSNHSGNIFILVPVAWVFNTFKKTSSCYGEIYHVLAAQFSAMSVFGTFFVSTSPPFKLAFTYVSLRNYFIQCQLNPAPTSVPF